MKQDIEAFERRGMRLGGLVGGLVEEICPRELVEELMRGRRSRVEIMNDYFLYLEDTHKIAMTWGDGTAIVFGHEEFISAFNGHGFVSAAEEWLSSPLKDSRGNVGDVAVHVIEIAVNI